MKREAKNMEVKKKYFVLEPVAAVGEATME